MAQSMAKELGKEMIHVSQAVVDGLIDTEHVKGMMGEPKGPYEVRRFEYYHHDFGCTDLLTMASQRLNPDAIAAEFYHLTQQHPSVWSHEIDLR